MKALYESLRDAFYNVFVKLKTWLMKKLNAKSTEEYNELGAKLRTVTNDYEDLMKKHSDCCKTTGSAIVALKLSLSDKSSCFCDFCITENLSCPYNCHRGSHFIFNDDWQEGKSE